MFRKNLMPFMDADGKGGGGAPDGGRQNTQNQQNQEPGKENQSQQAPVFDYDKLASIISGKQNVTEDTILKNYFRQQGLSKEEAEQAIQSFKEQKAKNQPDVGALQTQLAQYQEAAKKEAVEKAATLEAMTLGLDAKTIPYVLKLADLSGVVGTDGKVNQETLKNAINKVIEDVPQLRPATAENKGFQFGGLGNQGGTGNQQTTQTGTTATKRWNRFNN